MLLKGLSMLETMGQAGGPANTSGTLQAQVMIQHPNQQQAPMTQVQAEKPLVASTVEIPLTTAFTNKKHKYERVRKIDPCTLVPGWEDRGCS